MCVAALGIVGAVISAVGSIVGGIAQRNAYNAQAKALEQNARNDEIRAKQAAEEGAQKEGVLRERGEQIKGQQNAAYGAAGITGGSAWDVLRSTQYGIEQDAAAIQNETARTSWGYNVNAANSRNKAGQARAAGSNAMVAGVLSGASSYLGGLKK